MAKNTKVNSIQASLEDILKEVTVPTVASKIMTSNISLIIKQGKEFMEATGITWFSALIPIDKILTDMAYQRPIKRYRVNKIKREFTWDKVDYKCVNYRAKEKKFACIDGLHTLTALTELGYKFIPCKVFIGMTYQQEADFFSKQNKNTKRLSTRETFNAELEAENTEATMIKYIADKFGVDIATTSGHKKTRNICKLRAIYRAYEVDGLWFCFQLIKDAGWENDPKAYTEGALNIGFSAYPLCLRQSGKDISKTKYNFLIKILRRYPTSTKFVDEANVKYGVTVTKHPESCVKELVKEVMVKVNEQYERIQASSKAGKVKKVDTKKE